MPVIITTALGVLLAIIVSVLCWLGIVLMQHQPSMKRLALAILLAVLLSACGSSAPPPPPLPWIHGKAYAHLRYDAAHVCFYRNWEYYGEGGKRAYQQEESWSGRYFHDALRLEERGIATPSLNVLASTLYDTGC